VIAESRLCCIDVKSAKRGEIKELLLKKWPLCSWVNVQYSFAVISISSKLSNTSLFQCLLYLCHHLPSN